MSGFFLSTAKQILSGTVVRKRTPLPKILNKSADNMVLYKGKY